jgi:glutamyl-tRNA synthetase
MPGLKQRAETLVQLADSALFYVLDRPVPLKPEAEKLLTDDARARLKRLGERLREAKDWNAESVEAEVRAFAESEAAGLGKVAQPLRAALTGSKVSPGIFEVMAVLGRDEVLGRIDDVTAS